MTGLIAKDAVASVDSTDASMTRVGSFAVLALACVLSAVTANECHSKLLITGVEDSIIPSLLFGLVEWFWWVCVAVVLWLWARRKPQILRFSPGIMVAHLAAACISAVVHLELLQETVRLAGSHWRVWGDLYARLNLVNALRFGGELAIYAALYGIPGFALSQAQTRKALVSKLEVERQLSEAQLKALQMQMEPHFLFNTLNAITSLVAQRRSDEAMQTLAHLNAILRTTLQRRSPEKVPFTEELHLIESYLAIQKVRFAERIEIEIQATPDARRGLVPSFLLQPLVENAVRHGIESRKAEGRIETRAEKLGDKLWMRVRDNGNGIAPKGSQGHGIGLSNVRERLAFFYPNAHQFEIESPSEGGYQVTIQIPFEEAPIWN